MTALHRLLTAAAALALLLAGAGEAAEPYAIPVIIPLTGQAAFLGRSEATSLSLVTPIINGEGGIGGRPVTFAIQDDQSSPQVAIALLNAVLANHPPVVMGSTIDAICRAEAAVVKTSGPVLWCFSNAFHPDEGGWTFSSSFTTLDVDAAALRFAREHGWTRIAYITSTDATGQDFERALSSLLAEPANKALTVVEREHFAPADISVTAQIARIKAADPQVLFAWTTGTPFGTVLRGVLDGGFDRPIIASSGNETYAQMHTYAGILPREMYFAGIPSITPEALPRSRVRDAIERYQSAFKAAGAQPDMGANQAWDAAFIVVGALRQAGPNASPEQVRDAIRRLRGWSGINGDYDFRALPQRGVSGNWIVMQRWDPERGAFVGIGGPLGPPR